MRATLTFNLPEEDYDYKKSVKGADAHSALHEISQEIFRPARKHGYSDTKIQELVNKLDGMAREAAGVRDGDYETQYQDATELISLLEEKFYEIINSYTLDLE